LKKTEPYEQIVRNIEKQIARCSEEAVYQEVTSIAETIGAGSDEGLKQKAMGIAKSFLKSNKLVEPVTLARASFYLALKDNDSHPERTIKSIIHNSRTTNRWWMYLLPTMEKDLTSR